MTIVTTPPCMMCGKTSQVEVDPDAFERWYFQRELIQVAFPSMPAAERETLKTGTHAECWDAMFPDEDEEAGE